MIGFTPGFPYLGELDPKLMTPRNDRPRLKITPSSVAIGGNQTGIYPIESPGGWHIIGRTPMRLFNAGEENVSLLNIGDRIQFEPITKRQFWSYKEVKYDH
nr:carboxyltransferase domain-containing protein [Bacillus sp. JCM 19034]